MSLGIEGGQGYLLVQQKKLGKAYVTQTPTETNVLALAETNVVRVQPLGRKAMGTFNNDAGCRTSDLHIRRNEDGTVNTGRQSIHRKRSLDLPRGCLDCGKLGVGTAVSLWQGVQGCCRVALSEVLCNIPKYQCTHKLLCYLATVPQ